MKTKHRLTRWLTPSIAIALAFIASTPAKQISPTQDVLVKPYLISKLKINEVQFDPCGQDGGTEWIEIYNPYKQPVNVKGVRLKDEAGTVLAILPNVTLPSKMHYVVHLGPTVTVMIDTDFSDGDGNYFTGAPALGYLGNDSGGVLLQYRGRIYDAVFWGTGGAPSGSGYSKAVSQGKWTNGDYVELSYTSGHSKHEGATLGRGITSTDTNSSSDFMLDGGPNGAIPTPGTRNGMFVYSASRAIHWTQAVVQELMGIVSTANQMSLSVTSSTHANVVVTDPDLNGGFTVRANHTFNILHNGSPRTMTGQLTFEYERVGTAGATSYSSTARGVLASLTGTLAMTFHYVKGDDGFHKLTRLTTGLTDFTWMENGQSYAYSADNVVAFKQTGQNDWIITDNRNWNDWGSLPKTSTSSQTWTKNGDGKYHHKANQTQTAPAPPPRFGETQYDYGTTTLDYEADMTFDNDFGFIKSIKKMDKEWIDQWGNSISLAELTQPATYSAVRVSGQVLSPLGTFDITLDETIRMGFPLPDPNDPGQNYKITDQLTREIVAGEFIERGTLTGPTGSLSYFIDQQQGCGCGCNDPGCKCGGPDEDEGLTGGDVAGIAVGVGAAAGVCTWGTIVTTPAVITGAGVVLPAGIAAACTTAGAVWWLTWEWWH